LQSPLAPCTTASKGGNSQDQPAAVGPTHETGMSGSVAAPTPSTLKKDVGLTKVQAGKKKMDARKKSLKRLWCQTAMMDMWPASVVYWWTGPMGVYDGVRNIFFGGTSDGF